MQVKGLECATFSTYSPPIPKQATSKRCVVGAVLHARVWSSAPSVWSSAHGWPSVGIRLKTLV